MEILNVVSSSIAILGTLSVLITFIITRKKSALDDGKQAGIMETHLEYIKDKLVTIEALCEILRKNDSEINTRLATLEASSKSAHRRIDDIRDQLNLKDYRRKGE